MDLGQSDDARLETVRVLHRTVVSLRAALEKSRSELNSLRRRLTDAPELTDDNGPPGKELNMSDKSLDSDVFEPEEVAVNCVGQDRPPAPRSVSKGDSEESEEVDDIELIFTTDDTKEIGSFQEDLVSIAENEGWHKPQDGGGLRHARSHSVLVETDISKCGVIDENEPPSSRAGRRNTLAAPPLYRLNVPRGSHIPEGRTIVKFSESPPPLLESRPILVERNSSTKQECAAQTDITALPGGVHWRSESALAHHRVAHTFTTLPSKFAPPFGAPPPLHRRQSLRLSEKTQEARRVLLSDINFTSMVPELSRSADHLCQHNGTLDSRLWYPRGIGYSKPSGGLSPSCCWVKWGGGGCDCTLLRHRQGVFHHQSSCDCPPDSSSTSVVIPQSSALDVSCGRRHSTRPAVDALSYWAPPLSNSAYKPTWASVPSSPTHFQRSKSVPFSASYIRPTTPQSSVEHQLQPRQMSSSGRLFQQNRSQEKFASFKNHSSRNKVKFQDKKMCGWLPPGQSLPDLRLGRHDSGCGGGGDEDSTDSLIDESEDFLRRSIDSILAGSADPTYVTARRSNSEYNPGEWQGGVKRGQPFLARGPCDLRIDYWVKVIAEGGKVVVGRVRYVGPLPSHSPDQPHVGVQLAQPLGDSNGSFAGKRFFNCEDNYGIFVPFKKVIMAWSV